MPFPPNPSKPTAPRIQDLSVFSSLLFIVQYSTIIKINSGWVSGISVPNLCNCMTKSTAKKGWEHHLRINPLHWRSSVVTRCSGRQSHSATSKNIVVYRFVRSVRFPHFMLSRLGITQKTAPFVGVVLQWQQQQQQQQQQALREPTRLLHFSL